MTNELALFGLMSTKELASVLGVDVKTIQRTADSLDMNVERYGRSHSMMFTEAQATAIKLELANHSKVNSLTPKTELEKELIIQQALQLQQEKITVLQSQLLEAKPKIDFYDDFVEIKNSQTVKDVAKLFGYSQNQFFELLRAEGFIFKFSTSPIQKYLDSGIFEVKEKTFFMGDKEKSYSQTFITPKGITYLSKKIPKKEVKNA